MKNILSITAFILLSISIFSCSKKDYTDKVLASATRHKETKVRKPKAPKVISVSDALAMTAMDGGLYYEFQGRRYWKNYEDGKYYLFNRSMYKNKAFSQH